jgi:hypothetical protein
MNTRRLMGLVAMVFATVILSQREADAGGGLFSKLNTLFDPHGSIQVRGLQEPPGTIHTHVASFGNSVFNNLAPELASLAPAAADYPAVSAAPGFTFRYNPDLGIFERSPSPIGSVFVDVPQTVGEGHLDIGAAYFFQNFTSLNGDSLDSLAFNKISHPIESGMVCQEIHKPSPCQVFPNDFVNVRFSRFILQSNVVTAFATYGITDRWDVNLLVPVIHTSLDTTATATIDSPTHIHEFFQGPLGSGVRSQTRMAEGGVWGAGDILLRTKYRFTESSIFNVASEFVLRLPSGNPDNFQGGGDVTLDPLVSMAYRIGKSADVHAILGIDVDANQVSRTRGRYGLGGTFQIIPQLAFIPELIGSSGFSSSSVEANEPTGTLGPNNGFKFTGFKTKSVTVPRTDIVDLAMTLKGNLFANGVGFVGAIVPLNSDGLRTNVTPTAGFEWTF